MNHSKISPNEKRGNLKNVATCQMDNPGNNFRDIIKNLFHKQI